MKTQFTLKRLIIGYIVFALGLMTLLTLCIPLLRVNDEQIDLLISFNLLKIKTYESGFTLLDFESSAGIDDAMAIVSGILTLLQLLLSISTMIFAVLCIFAFNQKVTKKILCGLAISCLVFVTLYMILGIVFASGLYRYLKIFSDESWGLYSSADGYHVLYETSTETLSYLGFIFGTLLFIVYVACSILLKDDMAFKKSFAINDSADNVIQQMSKPNGRQKSVDVMQAKDVAEVLKQYKELLDSGIITQEEFNKKKNELLNN